jgi:hypothetical protein
VLEASSIEDSVFSYVGRVSTRPRTIVEPSVILAGTVSVALRSSIVSLFIAVLIIVKVRSIVLESLEARARYSYRSEDSVPKAKEIVGYLLRFKIDY